MQEFCSSSTRLAGARPLKAFTCFALLLLTTASVPAADLVSSQLDEAKTEYARQRARVLTAANEMAPSEYDRLYEGHSVGELLIEAAAAQSSACAMIAGQQRPQPLSAPNGKTAIIALLKASFESCDAATSAITSENALEPTGSEGTKLELVQKIAAHDADAYRAIASPHSSVMHTFRLRNARMAEVQPTWLSPLIQSDARLAQGYKVSFSHNYVLGGESNSFGNNRGLSLLLSNRVQLDVIPPAYFHNHPPAIEDGWGNATIQTKVRLISGNAEHGNYILTAMLARNFTHGAEQNLAVTGAWIPKLAFGKAWGRFSAQTMIAGVLPTGKIEAQGRIVEWNSLVQVHTTSHTFVALEENAAWLYGGPLDGKMQNLVTPAAFYQIRRKEWGPTHPSYALGTGMQIATSRAPLWNHNLIVELRVMF